MNKLLWYALAVLMPAVAVALKTRNVTKSLLALLLTLLGWVPGAVYAVYIVARSLGEDPLELGIED